MVRVKFLNQSREWELAQSRKDAKFGEYGRVPSPRAPHGIRKNGMFQKRIEYVSLRAVPSAMAPYLSGEPSFSLSIQLEQEAVVGRDVLLGWQSHSDWGRLQ